MRISYTLKCWYYNHLFVWDLLIFTGRRSRRETRPSFLRPIKLPPSPTNNPARRVSQRPFGWSYQGAGLRHALCLAQPPVRPLPRRAPLRGKGERSRSAGFEARSPRGFICVQATQAPFGVTGLQGYGKLGRQVRAASAPPNLNIIWRYGLGAVVSPRGPYPVWASHSPQAITILY